MGKIIIVTLLVFGIATPAHAYLDPGTGSMLLSLIVGVVASAWFAFKGFFYKIKNMFKKDGEKKNQDIKNQIDDSSSSK